jgi:hypothetical protein
MTFEPLSTEKKGEGQSEQRAEEELGSEMNLAKTNQRPSRSRHLSTRNKGKGERGKFAVATDRDEKEGNSTSPEREESG